MKAKLEIIIPVLIWAYFMSEAIRGGMFFAAKNFDIGSGSPRPIIILVFVIVPLTTFIVSVTMTLKPKKMPKFVHWIDQRLSPGAYQRMGQRIKFPLLGSLFFIIIALVGFIPIFIGHAPRENWLVLSCPGCLGMGLFLGWLFAKFILARKNA